MKAKQVFFTAEQMSFVPWDESIKTQGALSHHKNEHYEQVQVYTSYGIHSVPDKELGYPIWRHTWGMLDKGGINIHTEDQESSDEEAWIPHYVTMCEN